MWTPTRDFQGLVTLQISRRLEEASANRQRRRHELANQAAARGTLRSGGFETSVVSMTVEMFTEAGTGIIADLLSLASDVGGSREALDWLEKKCVEAIEQAGGGFERSLREGPSAVRLPSVHMERPVTQAVVRLKRDAAIAFGRARLRAAPRDERNAATGSAAVPKAEMRDFFISYAGEERMEFVGPLVEELTKRRGRTAWYSEAELTLGDSLLRRIDEGLARSRFGVVVLSPDFFRKPWPRIELDGLAARAVHEGRKVILPVWHHLDSAGIAEHSPILASLVGVASSDGVTAVADAIITAAEKDKP